MTGSILVGFLAAFDVEGIWPRPMTHICVILSRRVNRFSDDVTSLPELDPETQAASENVGERLRKARLKAGLSQEALAQRAKMTRSSYSRIEKGQTNVTIDSLVRIARGLGLDVDVRFIRRRDSDDG